MRLRADQGLPGSGLKAAMALNTDTQPPTQRTPLTPAEVQILTRRWPNLADCTAALDAIERVMAHGNTQRHPDGSPRKPGDWRGVESEVHLEHARKHLDEYVAGIVCDSGECAGAHLAARALMLVAWEVER